MSKTQEVFVKLQETMLAAFEEAIIELQETPVKSEPAKPSSKKTSIGTKGIRSSKHSEPDEKTVKGHLTKEQLDGMKFNDLKKLAADMGVKPLGKRDAITDAILAVEVEAPAPKKTEGDKKKSAKPLNAKGGLKVPSKAQAEEEQGEEPDELYEVVNSYPDADLKEILKTIGVSATGKHEALVDKVIRAINEGKIANPLEEDEEEAAEDIEENDTDEDGDLVDAFPQFAVNYAEEMTDERNEALQKIHEEIVVAYEEGDTEYDEADLDELISGFLADEYDPNAFTIEDKVGIYAEIRKLFVDDEGAEHEDGDPYLLNEDNYCCGFELEYVKKKKKFVCGCCGAEYDAD